MTDKEECGDDGTGECDCSASVGVRSIQGQLVRSGLDQFHKNGYYTNVLKDEGEEIDECDWPGIGSLFARRDQVQWYKSPCYPVFPKSDIGSVRRVKWKADRDRDWETKRRSRRLSMLI